jgi:tRNA(Ile)-lysidine synthase
VVSKALVQKVRRTLDQYDLIPAGARILVGLSGGSDSVALTLLLEELARHGEFSVVSLAHLNHCLRPTAGRDEAFCRSLSVRMGLPIAVESADVRGYAAAETLSIEDAARRLRYRFLERAADASGATLTAVGHTRDDQAETLLLKLMRGAGSTGLGGIYPRRGTIIRPLLDVSRDELRSYLVERSETWIEDESNADLTNPRNRIRHRVIPEMDATYGGRTSAALARAADLMREDGQWLDELAAARFELLAGVTAEGIVFEASALLSEPAPIRRRILLLAMRQHAPGREIARVHIDAGEAVLKSKAERADVPVGQWELKRGKLVLSRQRGESK